MKRKLRHLKLKLIGYPEVPSKDCFASFRVAIIGKSHISSEIGKAVNECRGEKPTDKLGSELADIVLRTFGMAEQLSIDIQSEIESKMAKNLAKGNFKNRLK